MGGREVFVMVQGVPSVMDSIILLAPDTETILLMAPDMETIMLVAPDTGELLRECSLLQGDMATGPAAWERFAMVERRRDTLFRFGPRFPQQSQ